MLKVNKEEKWFSLDLTVLLITSTQRKEFVQEIPEQNFHPKMFKLCRWSIVTILIVMTSKFIVFSFPLDSTIEFPSNTLDDLPVVNSINLNGTQLNSFPRNLFMNKNLETIRLCGIRLKSNELQNQLFSHLPRLEAISINDCNITMLPDDLFLGSSQLENISLAHNHLAKIPSMIFIQQTNLLNLDLSFNDLLSLDDAIFDETIHLNVLRLSYNRLSNISM